MHGSPKSDGAIATDRITICYPLAGDSLGGSHHSLLGLLQMLDQDRYRLLVVVEREGGKLAEHFTGFETFMDPAPPRQSFVAGRSFGPLKFLSTLAGIRSRARFLRDHGVSIVHTNDGRSHATWALAAKLANARLVWHHRGDPTARGLRFLAPLVADRIVTVSRFSLPRSKLSRAARQAQVVFSPFQTDITVDRAVQRLRILAELGLPDNALICGFFGTFIERKRPLLFIEAIARLRQLTELPVTGLMFGEADHVEQEVKICTRLKQPDLDDAVKLMGYRTPGAAWIAGCDILIVPAVDEPLGRTLVEAMLVGTPIVATRSGGNPEAILEGMGLLVSPDDPHALAKGCAQLVNDPAGTARMVAEARKSAVERFASCRHIAAITNIYENICT